MTSPAASTPASQNLARAWGAASRRRVLLQSGDRDCAEFVVGRVFRPHRLEPRLRQARLAARLEQLSLGTLVVSRLAYGETVDILPGPLERFYLLQIPLQGAADIEAGREAFVSDPGCASLLSPAPGLRMRWHAGNEQLLVRIPQACLQRFVACWSGEPELPAPLFDPRLRLQDHPVVADALLSMLCLGERGEEAGAALPVAQLKYRLMAALLSAQPHDLRERLGRSSPPLAPRCVRLVEDHLVAHCDEPLTPESLAALAGVSVRSLFLGFQRYRGVSPMKLLRELRLQRVREDLLAAPPGTRVTDIALRWGFTHLGRFSLEYRQAFGESPSATLARPAD